MRRLVLVLSAVCLSFISDSQTGYWQQRVNYIIDVSLNDKENTLDGFEKIDYINNSPDTLHFIWFHVWPNAYKNDQTAFSDQFLGNGNTKFYFSDNEQRGFINRLDFKVDNITAELEDHPQYIDVVKLVLPHPLGPGEKASITTPFYVKLPYNFSRGGHDGQSYQATQWYPKPAVYDALGWHPMPYLDQGEFYSEFGNYDVHITVPENYVVAATGELQNKDEIEWLKRRASFDWEPVKHKTKLKGGGYSVTVELFPESSKQNKTLHYSQDSVHDFAWFADKRFIVNYDTCRLATGKEIGVFSYYTPAYRKDWEKSVQFGKDAIHHYSALVGEYPYSLVSVVQGPASFGGGMEYPTITIISAGESPAELDNTIAHEIGHNWFYGILATNERDHPWMDEGINTYYDNKYDLMKYGAVQLQDRIFFETRAAAKTDQPINTSSERFNEQNYNLVAYYKTGEWMRYLESVLGTDVFNKCMQEYYRRWQFRHPQPGDFKQVITETSNRNLDSVFSLLDKKGTLPNQHGSGTQVVSLIPFGKPGTMVQRWSNYLVSKKNLLWVGPSVGFNSYDKFMIGGLVSNMKLPPSSFQFLLAPMYGTGSKKLTGLGFLFHTFYPDRFFRKIEIGILGSSFTSDQYNDEEGRKNYLGFRKLVPGIKMTIKKKDPRSHLDQYLQFKAFLINEDGISFYRDTIITGIDTSILDKYRITHDNRSLYQLAWVIENTRVLYPYRGELKIEKGRDFIRGGFTGNYFFNYPKAGGLETRLFAGKFFYTGARTLTKEFATDRYHLNMSGANGYEDYNYSDYFIGRNKFEGLASQQMMMRDGGFKIRTDLLAQKIGKTDDWLIAANFSTTIPSKINPLNLLPVKIPLKLFLDLGTYAEAWKPNAGTDRFLYNAGLQFPLFRETINIFWPLIYSDVYKSYIRSILEKKNRWLHTLSFSFDFSRFTFKKNNPVFNL